ncbi:MAG TPA: maleylpyruvate isomerase family mycothiol-dependent enzyme [Acidimicrobiales bacterium]|nr:maleylpyruvate isomerase family mycothiol-dependent enzyme [Acidimicrobiales bacterium]
MSTHETIDLHAAVAAEFTWLADVLDGLGDLAWDTPSLCAGWRVREVVAHMTMAVRYTPPEFYAELEACKGDFTLLSNRVATRDAALPTTTLVANLRDDALHAWMPPGGGLIGALSHVVIHGLDITVPLGVARPAPDETVLAVLDHLTVGGGHANFGFELDRLFLQATDVNWMFGSGTPISGTTADLALLISGRNLAPGRIVDR